MLYQTTNPHGGEVYSHPVRIDFSANINPFGTPPAVLEAVTASLPLLRQYPDPYCRELVAAIARHEDVLENQILCGNGAAELIFSLCTALKPRKAMVTAPCFSEYETALRSVGAEVERYALRREEDFLLTEAFLDTLSRWDGQLLMLCNPNNPTGRTIPRELLDRICDLCRERGVFLFVDECFLDLTENGGAMSLKNRLSDVPGLLLLKAFTKSYGMAGLRLGYCLSGNAALLKTMGETTQAWNVSIPAQKAGVAALSQQEFLAKANEVIRQERAVLRAALAALGMSVIPSETNYILFSSDRELREPLLRRGIQIRSCANYPGLGQGWYRIAVKLPEENRQLIQAMEAILHG